ncbi:hypothetical protein COLO4_00122 [Corchorus olitorius]|uniref:Uncharacterized protein n=1 Tax=Corchorus olitorius TaxID=93759 RepID=A0A1R3L4M0_9ROSI|nr:hypothetical protein COLO4_00122 [Corchorus olitorius]
MEWTWAGSEDWERRSSASWSRVSSPITAFTMIFDCHLQQIEPLWNSVPSPLVRDSEPRPQGQGGRRYRKKKSEIRRKTTPCQF